MKLFHQSFKHLRLKSCIENGLMTSARFDRNEHFHGIFSGKPNPNTSFGQAPSAFPTRSPFSCVGPRFTLDSLFNCCICASNSGSRFLPRISDHQFTS